MESHSIDGNPGIINSGRNLNCATKRTTKKARFYRGKISVTVSILVLQMNKCRILAGRARIGCSNVQMKEVKITKTKKVRIR